MQWVMKKRSYWKFGELLNPGVRTLIYATDPKQQSMLPSRHPSTINSCSYGLKMYFIVENVPFHMV